MRKWLDDNDILIYSSQNEAKPVVATRFIKKLKVKIYKTMKANDSKSYVSYLNKLVDQYNNTYHCSLLIHFHLKVIHELTKSTI